MQRLKQIVKYLSGNNQMHTFKAVCFLKSCYTRIRITRKVNGCGEDGMEGRKFLSLFTCVKVHGIVRISTTLVLSVSPGKAPPNQE
jgi:hypothetical protein